MPERQPPVIRPLEAVPDPHNGRVILRDPTCLAAGMLVAGRHELVLLSLMDGTRSLLEIQCEYARMTGELMVRSDLEALLDRLDETGFLEGEGFEAYYRRQETAFLAEPVRPLRDPDSFGAAAAELDEYLDGILAAAADPEESSAPVALVAPHLDFPRGAPCYGAAYAALRGHRPARVVILGTNHFGRSRSVVATRRHFETHWGVVESDLAFLDRLQAACSGNLSPYEFDHAREHSIELQAVWLRHVLGDGFRIVAALCPDPSGPLGTAPGDPDGVDLRAFALALRGLIAADPEPTLVVASADLSHVGAYFGDPRPLRDDFLAEVRECDHAALAYLDAGDPEGYRRHMATTENPTRVCSVGCLYAAFTAVGAGARVRRLGYHQAVTRELQNAVTCCAYALYAGA